MRDVTASPHYSGQKTAVKFFKTIENNPILGAKDRSKSHLPSGENSPIRVYERAPSAVHLRILEEKKYREKLPFDSNIHHGLNYIEKVVR
jgi:hypothetical protein